MSADDIAGRRLSTQRLTGEPFESAVEAVGRLTAVQSQDYAGAKWALGQRVAGLTDAGCDRLCDAGAILRTHVMRPTWHLVLPDDVVWLQALTGPRVKALMRNFDRRAGVDTGVVPRAVEVMGEAVAGGNHLTRPELGDVLERAGITARGPVLAHLVMHAELDGVLVSGPRRGKQMTYALLAERAPTARRLERDEALGELVRRYFAGHGPAQVRDFTWWSGLTATDARRGLEIAGDALRREVIDGLDHWRSRDERPPLRGAPGVHLLPNYDEYIVAYRDRSAVLDPARPLDLAPFPVGSILAHTVLLDGRVLGGWKRRPSGRGVAVELGPLPDLDAPTVAGLEDAAARLARFLELPVSLRGR